MLPVVDGVLDPGCLISSLSSIAILPGRDRPADPRRRPTHPVPEAAPADRVQLDVGAHRLHRGQRRDPFVPGSHLRDHCPDYGKPYDSIPAEMPKGSVLIWHGSLWHGGGANTTDERRVGIAMNYCAGYIRQQENQQLGLSRDDRRGSRRACASSRLQRVQHAHRPHQQALPGPVARRHAADGGTHRLPTTMCLGPHLSGVG